MELTIRPATMAERMYTYRQSSQISGQCGLIGYLRADFGADGSGFFSSWNDYSADLKTPEFRAEYDAVINALRFDDAYQGILSCRDSLRKFCRFHPESGFAGGREYGVRANSENYAYLLRLNPNAGEYNLYCFCYRREWLDRHLHSAENGIRFTDPNYNERFRINDGDKIKIYPVGASSEEYTVELNFAPEVSVSDTVIKGQISIIKHRDNGETQIETPEEGAEFQIYLASAGSYENAKDTERDTLVCDSDGFAVSKALPYGIYTVHQTKGYPDTELMPDFTVYIAGDGQNYKYLINNAPYEAYIKVIKADSETKKQIPLSGAGFEIYDADGNRVEMICTYPSLVSIDTFYVSEDGSLITPEALPAGDYTLVEVQAPRGYVLDSTPIPFTVTAEANEAAEDINTISVTVYNKPQKGTVCITKSDEVFSSVKVTGEEAPANKDGPTSVLKNAVYTPVYETKGLAGAKYRIIAAEDIGLLWQALRNMFDRKVEII